MKNKKKKKKGGYRKGRGGKIPGYIKSEGYSATKKKKTG